MKKTLLFLTLFLLPLLLSACVQPFGSMPVKNEILLRAGMVITVTNDTGTLRIRAGNNYQRFYTWAGGTRTATLWPRKQRWDGSLGLYFPGPGNHWQEHDGITRAVIEEGILNFDSMESLLYDLSHYTDQGNLVYTDDGLCVYWCKNPGAGGTLSLLMWQLLINGKKPTSIPDSKNDQIILSYQ